MEAIFRQLDSVLDFLSRPEILVVGSIFGLLASLKWYRVWTKPPIAILLGLGIVLTFLYGWNDWPGVSHAQFRISVLKPDNVPILFITAMLAFFYWLAMRKSAINDERAERGQPPMEAVEKHKKVLVWPDLVYIELIAMVICIVLLVVWSMVLKAPIEEPANASRTPNPSKAPWYFLGLQELLVYFDPWLAGVVIPGTILVGLMAIPYVDRNPKGNGYYTLADRKGAIFVFLFGFFILWVIQMFIGTFLRGPGWNFFGLMEEWTLQKSVELGNIDVSEIVYVKLLGMPIEPKHWLPRELPGILLVLAYFGILPVLISRTVGKKLFRELGAVRFGFVVNLGLFMAAVPLKMGARWLFNLKYVVNIHEVFLNI